MLVLVDSIRSVVLSFLRLNYKFPRVEQRAICGNGAATRVRDNDSIFVVLAQNRTIPAQRHVTPFHAFFVALMSK